MDVRSGIKNAAVQIFNFNEVSSASCNPVVMCKSIYFKQGHLPMPIAVAMK